MVGTGPWMFDEYVVGSYMSFKKNPNYWGTTIVDGVEYQLPFMDGVVLPIIPDVSTQLAALRTGTADISATRVPPIYWTTLDTSVPQLMHKTYKNQSTFVDLRCDKPPFDDVKVRQAMMVGIDQSEFVRLRMAEDLSPYWFPLSLEDWFEPEEMPTDFMSRYDYNPTLAMEMLTEVLGPPDANGIFFKTEVYCSTNEELLDFAVLLKDQWAGIGVELEIIALDEVELYNQTYPLPVPLYTGCVFSGQVFTNPLVEHPLVFRTGGGLNMMQYSNPTLDELLDRTAVETDPVEQKRLIKEAALIIMEDTPSIPLSASPARTYWWPWVKNYYGELSLQDDCCRAATVYPIWIDQDLKAEMGY